MANANPLNFGSVTGRLARDLAVFTNKDGSRSIRFTVMARQNWTKRDGTQGADAVSLETYIPAHRQNNGIYDYAHKGDLVQVFYRPTTQSWVDAMTGETQYRTVLEVTDLQMLESKEITNARIQKRSAEQDMNDIQQLPVPQQPHQATQPTLQNPVWNNTPAQPHFAADQGNVPF